MTAEPQEEQFGSFFANEEKLTSFPHEIVTFLCCKVSSIENSFYWFMIWISEMNRLHFSVNPPPCDGYRGLKYQKNGQMVKKYQLLWSSNWFFHSQGYGFHSCRRSWSRRAAAPPSLCWDQWDLCFSPGKAEESGPKQPDFRPLQDQLVCALQIWEAGFHPKPSLCNAQHSSRPLRPQSTSPWRTTLNSFIT